jgi:peptide/nickel transport system permease protein
MTAFLTRIIKTSLASEMKQSYVVLARSKGLSDIKIFFTHILKNALSPVISTMGLQMGALLSGTIVTETIFSWQGIGSLLIKAVTARDYPMIQGMVVFLVMVYLSINLVVDLIYLLIDPRQRNGFKKNR